MSCSAVKTQAWSFSSISTSALGSSLWFTMPIKGTRYRHASLFALRAPKE